MKTKAQRTPIGLSLNQKSFTKLILQLLSLAILFLAVSVPAAQWIWDPLTNGGTTSGSGNWDTTATNWSTGTNDSAWTQTSTTVGLNGAVFNGPDAAPNTYMVTNDATQIAVTNLIINNSGYNFTGQALDITSADFMTLAPGKSVTFSCSLAADNNAKNYIAGSGSVVNITGNILAQQPKLCGPGAFYLSGVNTPSVLYNLGPVYLTNGSITTSASFFVAYQQTVNGVVYSNATLTISGGASATQNGNVLMVGRGAGQGTLTLLNGSINVGTTAAHDLALCYDSSGGESGTLNVYGGTVTVGNSSMPASPASKIDFFDTAGGGAGATGVLNQTNGVIYAWGGIQFGLASGAISATASAVLTNTGGFLYLGQNGINFGASAPANFNVSLSGGTVGALANWASAMPMTLATSNGNITFQCADNNSTPYNISLSGLLSGAGGLYVTGGGTLTLSGSNSFAGNTTVSNGTLAIVTGANAATNGAVTLDGSAGSPTVSARVSNRGQYWSISGLSYVNGATTADFQYGSVIPSTSVAAIQVSGNVSFSSTPNVTVEGTAIPAGTYPLIQYTGTVSGTMPTTVTLPSYASGHLTNLTATKTIALVISSSTYITPFAWAVGSGVWDTTTVNWQKLGNPTTYSNGFPALFDDTASGTSPITVTLNTLVNPSEVTANNTAKQYIITGSGSITGSSILSVLGGGTLTLTGTNTYSGGTVISAGKLNINNGGTASASAIGTGPLTLNAGALLDNTSGSNIALQLTIPETWNGSFTYVGSSNNFNTGVHGASDVTMNANTTITVISNNLTISGSISDNGNNYQLIKTGNGTLTLPFGNNFGGGVTLQSGLLNLGDPNCLGSGVFEIVTGSIDNISGAPLSLSSPLSYIWVNNFTVLGTANLDLGSGSIVDATGPLTVTVVTNTFSTEGVITSGNSIITKAGNGTWVIGGGYSSSHQLQLTVNAGEVQLAKGEYSIGLGGSGLTVNAGGLALDVTGDQIYHGGGTLVPVTLSGGVWDLNGNNETVDKFSISNGTLQNSASGSASTFSMDTTNQAVLTGTNCQFNVVTADSALTFNAALSGAGTLVKNGAGVLYLMTNEIYTGGTTINGGTLALQGVASLSNSTDIYLAATNSALDLTSSSTVNANNNPVLVVQNGQTLGGFGVVTGLVQTVSGGIVAPGSSSTIGILTVTGYNDSNTVSGTTMMKLDKGHHTNDILSVSGRLALGGTLSLTNLSGTLAAGDSFTLFNAAGGLSGAMANVVPSRPDYPAFGLAWNTSTLASNGKLSVVAATVPTAPRIASFNFSGTTLTINGTNGVANDPFVLMATTNLSVPISAWTPVATNTFSGSGGFSINVSVTNAPQQFFVVWMQ